MTPEGLALYGATKRLRDLGVSLPELATQILDPELELYRTLARAEGDPYSRYNSLRRELVSFLSALEGRLRRQRELEPIAQDVSAA